MKAQTKNQLNSIFNIVCAYVIIGVLIACYDYFVIHGPFVLQTDTPFLLSDALKYNIGAGFCAGLLGGILLTTLNKKIRNKPFIYGQIWGLIIFTTIFLSVSITIDVLISQEQANEGVSFPEAQISSFYFKNLIVWGVVFQLTQFYLQLQQKFGPGNLYKIFFGIYQTPKVERRIFMFLDLKSSTSIAEKLGEQKYHAFLQDVFADITDPIGENKAEIYQYVGDEIVVSWHLKKLKDKSLCTRIYFDIASVFEAKKQEYLDKYGVVPTFKAGAHIGDSIVGEIGIIKKDITYSGDLLNTCARIQGKCNELNATFLISGVLKAYLADSIAPSNLTSKGFIALRGKAEQVELFAVADGSKARN